MVEVTWENKSPSGLYVKKNLKDQQNERFLNRELSFILFCDHNKTKVLRKTLLSEEKLSIYTGCK